MLLKGNRHKEKGFNSLGKLSNPTQVNRRTFSEKPRQHRANRTHNLGANSQPIHLSTAPQKNSQSIHLSSAPPTNNTTLESKTQSITNTSDCNTMKHQTLVTEVRRNDCSISDKNCSVAYNAKVTVISKPHFKSRIPVPITRRKKSSDYPRIRHQPVHCFNMSSAHMVSSRGNSPNCLLNYYCTNHGTCLLNTEIHKSCLDHVCGPRCPTVISQNSRICNSKYKSNLSKKELPIKKHYIVSKNKLNPAGRTAQYGHGGICNLGATETGALASQSLNRHCTSNNCHRPARDYSSHIFTTETKGQNKVARLTSLPITEEAKHQQKVSITDRETRRKVETASVPCSPDGNTPIRTNVAAEEEKTGVPTLKSVNRAGCDKLHTSIQNKEKPTKSQCCYSKLQPDKTSRINTIRPRPQKFQHIHVDCCEEANTYCVSSPTPAKPKTNKLTDSTKITSNVAKTIGVVIDTDNFTSPVHLGTLADKETTMTDNEVNNVVSHSIFDLSILPSAVYKRNHPGLCTDLESDCDCCMGLNSPGENCTVYNSSSHYISTTRSKGNKLHQESKSQKCKVTAQELNKHVQKLKIHKVQTKMPRKSLESNTSHERACTEDVQQTAIAANSQLRCSPGNGARSPADIKCPTKGNANMSSVTPDISNGCGTNTLSWICTSTTDDVSASFIFGLPSHSFAL